MARNMFKTRVTQLLGIQYPIIMGGMAWVGRAELVAAVSNAGGLGIIGSVTFNNKDDLRKEVRRAKQLTSKPFGVNITLLPAVQPRPADEFVDVVLEEGVAVVETSGRSPEPFIKRLKQGGVKVIHKVGAVRHAVTAERVGCDAVFCLGFEGAGHPMPEDVTALDLIPAMVDAVKVPVIAAGGIADARGFVAALALGAEGVMMGTRFMVTKESVAHPLIKEALAKATEADTVIIQRSINNQARVLRNKAAEKTLEMEARGATLEELLTVISGELGHKALSEGNVDGGTIACGQGVGLIHDVPTVKEVIDGIIKEATAICQRLGALA